MRRPMLMTITVLGLAAAGLGADVLGADAQPAPPPPPMASAPHGPPAGPWSGHPWGHGRPGAEAMRARLHHMMSTFALFHRPADRKLSGADVQKIAEAFLLWNGNHDWKITGVTEQDERTVGFNVATPSDDVIAHFTMDRHTGEVTRDS